MEPIVVNLNPPPPPPDPPTEPGKRTNWKKIGIIVAAVLVAVVGIILAVNGYQSHKENLEIAQKKELAEILRKQNFNVDFVLATFPDATSDPVAVTVRLKEDALSLENYEHIRDTAESVFCTGQVKAVDLTVSYGDKLRYSDQDYREGKTPPEAEKKGFTATIPAPEKAEDQTTTQPDTTPKPEPEPEPTMIWQRSQSDVIDAIRSTLAGQTLYSHTFALENYETGEGTLYAVTMDGFGTGVGIMWMTDTVNGGKKPCVICEDINDGVNATAFSMASIALVKECGGYSLSTAQSKFNEIYNAVPSNGNTINTTVDGTGYILTISGGTTVLSAQKP